MAIFNAPTRTGPRKFVESGRARSLLVSGRIISEAFGHLTPGERLFDRCEHLVDKL
jgi:hypothetical protein